jgi:dipeptidyl aminopeptidase/acylaminoacyl peptidase
MKMNGRTIVRLSVWLLLCACGAGAAPARQGARLFTVEDYVGIKWITSAQISPDGARVLYTVAEADAPNNRQRASLWIVAAREGATPHKLVGELAYPPNAPNAPQWSPDGARVAFASERDGASQVWLISASGGEATRLTNTKAGVQEFAWSPAGDQIAFVAAEPTVPPQPDEPRVFGSLVGGAAQLFLINVATKEATQLTKGSLSPSEFAWSPDAKEIAFTSGGDLRIVSVKGGAVRTLVERAGQDRLPRYSPDGKRIAFFTNFGKPGVRRGIGVVAAAGGAPRDLEAWEPGFGGYPPWFLDWAADNKTVLSAGLARMRQNLYALSTETAQARAVTSGASVYHDFSLSRDRRTLAFLASDSTTPTEVYVSAVDDFRPRRLTETNPQLAGVRFGETEAVGWKSKDGLDIEGLLLKPADYEAGRRYPMVVLMEGTFGSFDFSFTGRVSADSTAGFMFPFQQQLFAARGYAVLMPNPRGSWGYGAAFNARAAGDFGFGPYHDIASGVDSIVARGVADPERLGVLGIFVDAYRAAFATSQTTRFKAAVLAFPIFDLVSWYG